MSNNYTEKALEMVAHGYTVIPLNGKRPVTKDWQNLRRVTSQMVLDWERQGLWRNIGLVTGAASNNIVVLDFDGLAGYELFKTAFPELVNTLTVATGSGKGMHVYYKVELLPNSGAVMDILLDDGELVNIELKSDGKQVVIPPSLHPDTGKAYVKHISAPIMALPDLTKVWNWAQSLKPREWQPPKQYSAGDGVLNRKLIDAIAAHFRAQPHQIHGDWVNCSCPNAAAHKNGDKHYSFGFNERDGGANCYACGGMSLKSICEHIGLNPADYGGIFEPNDTGFRIRTATGCPPAATVSGDKRIVQQGDALPVVKRSDRLTSYLERLHDYEQPRANAPIPFPMRVLHRFHGMAEACRPGKLLGVVGASGGGKSTLLETMVDGWLSFHVPCLVWSPEWEADEFIERAVQRYGGPSTSELYLHEMYITERQRGIKGGIGVEMPTSRMEAAAKAVRTLRSWQEEVGYLDFPFLTIAHLMSSMETTLKAIDFTPRVLVIDYVQLLHALEPSPDLSMYNLLLRIKAVCKYYNLLGVVATQVTKESAKGQQQGNVLDSQSARFVNDDAFNLFITINPDRKQDGTLQNSAVLYVAKNSMGISKQRVRVPVDWEHMVFGDQLHPDQTFDGEV